MSEDGHAGPMRDQVRLFFDLFKLRIGFAIGLTALAGALAVPGRQAAGAWQIALLVACVIAASASAGALTSTSSATSTRAWGARATGRSSPAGSRTGRSGWA